MNLEKKPSLNQFFHSFLLKGSQSPVPGFFSINCSVVFSVLTLLAPTMQEHKTHVDLIGAISFY